PTSAALFLASFLGPSSPSVYIVAMKCPFTVQCHIPSLILLFFERQIAVLGSERPARRGSGRHVSRALANPRLASPHAAPAKPRSQALLPRGRCPAPSCHCQPRHSDRPHDPGAVAQAPSAAIRRANAFRPRLPHASRRPSAAACTAESPTDRFVC